MQHVAVNPWVAFAYLVAGVCFILALRGLSSPTTSQRGNRFGMIGMAIAVVTTLVTHVPTTTVLVEGADFTALLSTVDTLAADTVKRVSRPAPHTDSLTRLEPLMELKTAWHPVGT